MAKGSGGTKSISATTKSLSKNLEKINNLFTGEFNPKTVFGRELTSGDKYGVAQFRAFLSESKSPYDINIPKLNEALQERAKEATVEVKDIYPIQNYLNKNRVADYLTSPLKNLSDRKLNVVGYRLPNGKVILDDGHHRVAASIIKGEKTVSMRIVDVNEYMAKKYFKSLSKKK